MEDVDDSRAKWAGPSTALAAPVVVGIGANLGNPALQAAQAVELIGEIAPIQAVSGLYKSAPVGGPDQGDYVNAALLFSYPGDLHRLLIQLGRLETKMGRVRGVRWGPRTIDLDLLWAGDRIEATSSLTIPHPELKHRAFALKPLLDVVPTACDPVTQVPYSSLLGGLSEQRVDEIGQANWWKRCRE